MNSAGIEAAAEAIRELFSWQVFAPIHEKLTAGDWAHVAATKAVEAYLATPPPEPQQ